jgi:hypothetical protein
LRKKGVLNVIFQTESRNFMDKGCIGVSAFILRLLACAGGGLATAQAVAPE